jgi:Lipopolysaccharide-assembly, LptC-related
MKLSPALLLPLSLSMMLFSPAGDVKSTEIKGGTLLLGKDATTPAAKPADASPAIPGPVKATPKGRGAPTSSLDALFKLVEIGRTHEGVRYPVLENGKMTSMVQSERMTRIDDNLLEMENAVIDQRADDPIKFYLQRATFNRKTDQLLSSQPTRIEGQTYEIEGDTMSYDRKNSVARLDGRVRMIVYDKTAPPKEPAVKTNSKATKAEPEGKAVSPAPASKTSAPSK